jgi:multidrug efflux system membrane fusion protein
MSHIAELIRTENFQAAEAAKSPSFLKKHPILTGASAAALLGLGAIWHSADGSTPPVVNVPPVVTTAAVNPQAVRVWSDFSGRTAAVNAADIRPEVTGRVTEIRFKDGQSVHAGDILMVIDPRPYEAAVAKAEADLATANNNSKLAGIEFERAQRLMAAQAVAHDLYDTRDNARGVAVAAVQAAQAALTQAKLDVDHAYVKAPIDGRASRAEITVGNLVQAGVNAPLLTSIVSNDGIYADFDVDEQTYLQSIRAHAATIGQEQRIPVQLSLQGDKGHVYPGTIESFDNKIATGTGTIRARARFANTDGALIPGMFVTVRLANAIDSKVLLVPDEAVQNDQSKRYVYVVGADRKAVFREIALGQEVEGRRIVTAGLRPGERIIVDGLQRVQPGAVVDARLTTAQAQPVQR